MSTTTQPARAGTALTVLITGANKGLGRESARLLVDAGHTVYLGSRDATRGQQAADEIGAHLLVIDVTDDASVQAAVTRLRDEVGHLDVLVNNAGIIGDPTTPTDQVTAEDLAAVYATNVFGAVRVTQAFLPLLRDAATPVIVNVSSGTGSIHRTTDPSSFESTWPALAYASSKAALNMITVQYAKALPEVRVNAVEPGFTATDATGQRGQSVTDGAAIIIRMAQLGADSPTGAFLEAAGTVPW